MKSRSDKFRVGLVAGTLGKGGAEKQLVYIVRALQEAGVEVRVFSLTQGEFHESTLRSIGIEPTWVGEHKNPMLRLAVLSKAVGQFRPHVLQSIHFFTNLYTTIIARRYGIPSIGGIRSDTNAALSENPFWGQALLRCPHSLVVNSFKALQIAEARGAKSERLFVLPNVIDLEQFDALSLRCDDFQRQPGETIAMAVGRVIPVKRFDCFISATARGQAELGSLKGVIVGDGPERSRLEAMAQQRGLSATFEFLGQRNDVPAILRHADMLVLCSEAEGFPNVLLEAMAARLPVITTPAGDAAKIVENGVTGYVVPFNDEKKLAERMVYLGKSPALRESLGKAGRRRVEENYSFESLPKRLITFYRKIAIQENRTQLIHTLQYL